MHSLVFFFVFCQSTCFKTNNVISILDENNKNELAAQNISTSTTTSSRPNLIKSSMLRPSSFANASEGSLSSSSLVAEATSLGSKTNLLKPAAFHVGNTENTTAIDEVPTSTTTPLDTKSPTASSDSTENENHPKPNESTNGVNPEEKKVEKVDPLFALSKNGLPKSNLFTASKSTIPPISSDNSGFVFGQNVHERVTGVSSVNSKPSNFNFMFLLI